MAKPDAPVAREFVLTRSFDAPLDLVFRVWTEREHLQRWMSPKGASVIAAKMDLRPGGTYHYGLRTPDGHEMWGKWLFREIVVPERLVLIQSFSDPAGGLTRHPHASNWPLYTLSTMTFVEQLGRTTLTLRWAPYEAAADEIHMFDSSHSGMQQGWAGTMEQLTAYLTQLQTAPPQ